MVVNPLAYLYCHKTLFVFKGIDRAVGIRIQIIVFSGQWCCHCSFQATTDLYQDIYI